MYTHQKTESSFLEYCKVKTEKAPFEMRCHFHTKSEFIYVHKGNLLLYIDGAELKLEKGEICYVKSNMLHRGESNDCIFESVTVDVMGILGQNSRLQESIKNTEDVLSSRNCRLDTSLFEPARRIFDIARENGKDKELCVLSALCDFYLSAATDVEPFGKDFDSSRLAEAKTVITYIQSHFREDISLADISRITKLSQKYLCRYFKHVTGHTPIDYLNLYRSQTARSFLKDGFSVADTAYECGFSDTSYFVRTFKKYMHVTPKQYALGGDEKNAYVY